MNDYETHKPILELIINNYPVENIIEFGLGYYSTPLFLEKCKHTTSVEMQSEEWFNKIKDEYLKYSNKWTPLLSIGPFTYKDLQYDSYYNLAFIDGHGESRWDCINYMFDKTSIVIAHDTNTPSYNWNRVNKPTIFNEVNFVKYNTKVWTSDNNIFKILNKFNLNGN